MKCMRVIRNNPWHFKNKNLEIHHLSLKIWLISRTSIFMNRCISESLLNFWQINSIAFYHVPSLYLFPKGRLTTRIENAPNPGMYRRPVVLFPASLWFGFSSNALCRFLGVRRKHRLLPYPNCSPAVSLLALRLLFTITSKPFNSVYIETQVMRNRGTLLKFLVFSWRPRRHNRAQNVSIQNRLTEIIRPFKDSN